MPNSVVWSAITGNWNIAANWTPATVPTRADDAVINASGADVTVNDAEAAQSVMLNDAGATLTVAAGGTLAVGGPLTLDAGRFNLGGVVSGGSVTLGSATVNYQSGGALDGTAIIGTVDLSQSQTSQQATGLENGATVQAANGGPGLILDTGGNSSVGFGGSTPGIDNVTIDAGAAGVTDYVVVTGTTVFGAGAALSQTGAGSTVDVYGATWTNNGTIDVAGVGGVMNVTAYQLTNNGVITVENGGTLVAADNTYNSGSGFTDDGTVDIATGGTLHLVHAASGSGAISFVDGTGRLRLDAPSAAAPAGMPLSIAGFQQGDAIDLTGTAADAASFAGNVLTISDNGNTVATLNLAGAYASSDFGIASDGSGGTAVTTAACYLRGTRIATLGGDEAAVEDLVIGDLVATPHGPMPVRWIGRRSYSGRFVPARRLWRAAGKLGPGRGRTAAWLGAARGAA